MTRTSRQINSETTIASPSASMLLVTEGCFNHLQTIAQIPFGASSHVSTRHDSTRSTCRASRTRRVERVEPCCSTSSTQPQCMSSTRRTCRVVSCRDVMWRAKWNLGLCSATARQQQWAYLWTESSQMTVALTVLLSLMHLRQRIVG